MNSNSRLSRNGEKLGRPREILALTFIDSNVLFRMFAAPTVRIEQHRRTGSCGNKALDYAIELLLKLGKEKYSTSEIALMETVGVASRLGGSAKAERMLEAVMAQEGFRILETNALAYPIAFAFILAYHLEARDSLHLAVAFLGGVSTFITSDGSFATGTQSMMKQVKNEGFHIPLTVRTIYRLGSKEAELIEQTVASISTFTVERAPG